jgi:hypothetical protein
MKNNKPLVAACVMLAVALVVTIGLLLSGNPAPEYEIVTEPAPFTPEVIEALEAVEYGELTLAFSETESFHTGAFAVDIIASNPNARIYYTTDGSLPTTESRLFSAPVPLIITSGTRGAVIRAIAVYGEQISEPLTQTFFIGRQVANRFDTLIFSLSTNPEHLFCHYNGIFVPGILREEFVRANPGRNIVPPDPANFNLRGREAERPVYIEVFSPEGERIFTQAAGMRTHGGWSRAAEYKSIRLVPRREYSPDYGQFHFDFFPWEYSHNGTPILRYDNLILRNGGNDRYHGIFRNELGSLLARNAGFTGVSPFRPVAVFLNGDYYGMAWLQVRFNEQYLQELFDTPTRNIDVVGSGERWHETEDQRIIDDLNYKNTFANKNLLDDEIFAELESIVDIENLLFYYAFQIYMGAEDWPHNNLRRWRYTGPELGTTPETDGRWRYLFVDLDWTLGLYGDDYTKPTFYRVVTSRNPRSPLLKNILTRPDMQNRFIEIMHYISENIVTEQTVTDAVEYLLAMAENEFTHALRAGKFPHWFGMGFAEYNHNNMIDFARNRHRQIFADMSAYFSR